MSSFRRNLVAVATSASLVLTASDALGAPKHDIGVVLATKDEILALPAGRVFGVLVLHSGDWVAMKSVCSQLKTVFGSTIHDGNVYDRTIYVAIKSPPVVATLDCDNPQNMYDARISYAVSGELNLDIRGDGPFLVVVKTLPGGHRQNAGFVDLAGLNSDSRAGAELARFSEYFMCSNWRDDFSIDDAFSGQDTFIVDQIFNFIFGGAAATRPAHLCA